jgi:hypothetical protein
MELPIIYPCPLRAIELTPDQLKERNDRMRALRLKSLDNQLEVETLRYSMEYTMNKKSAIKIKIAVIELKKEQLMRD